MGSISANGKPTVLVVPGAWHKYQAYLPMMQVLEREGYNCVGVNLPNVTWSEEGRAQPPTDFGEDVDTVRSKIEELSDAGHDVLLFMHSYAGIPGSTASKGLDKDTRAREGKKGGIVKLVYCCAFNIPEGVTLNDAVGGKPATWWRLSPDGTVVEPADPHQVFYTDLSKDDPRQASMLKEATESLLPIGIAAFNSKNEYYAPKDMPSVYIVCTLDKAIPVQGQQAMVQGMRDACQGKDKDWLVVETLESAHSPFLSMPEATAKCVRRAAGESV